MAAKTNLTKEAQFSTVNPRELDFVTRFTANWDALIDIMGISRPIKKELGAVLKYKTGSVTLHSGVVAEGDEIPYSIATVTETAIAEMSLKKWTKAVSIEAIKSYGYDIAVQKTDDAFLTQLQNVILGDFYTFLATGSLTDSATTFQSALAKAKGDVLNKFSTLNLTTTEVVGFCNILDFYDYLGTAPISVQNRFGLTYVKDFMGFNTLFLLDANKVARNKVFATPVENIVMYYVDPSDSGFANAGLEYTVDGVTPLLGFHTEGNYRNAVSENYAIMGVILFAEYLDGIANVTIGGSNP